MWTSRFIIIFLLITFAVVYTPAGVAQTNVQDEKQRKEAEKKAKDEARAREKAEKEAEKQRRKEYERQEKLRIAAPPNITVTAKAETFGQVLTTVLNSRGFTLAEYQQPQQVFGSATPYKAVYTMPITDFSTSVNMGVWIYLNYGVPTRGQGPLYYFMAFEITDTPQGSFVTARYGMTSATTRGVVVRDMTSEKNFRIELDDILDRVKEATEKIAVITKPPTPSELDLSFWEIIRESQSAEDYKIYLEKFPVGEFAEIARKKSEELPSRPEAAIARKHGELAVTFAGLAKWDEAENEWREAVRLEPNSLLFISNLVNLLGQRNKWAEVEHFLSRAIELDPKNARWHGDLGLSLMRQEKWSEGEAAISEAISLDPNKALWRDMLEKARQHKQP